MGPPPSSNVKTLTPELETLTLSPSPNVPAESPEPEIPKEEPKPEEEVEADSSPEEKEKGDAFPCPLRPVGHDCAYYVRTGACRYGLNCKFNHPLGRTKDKSKFKKWDEPGQIAAKEKEKYAFSEIKGKTFCKYYLTPGGCKYGYECNYVHQEKTEEVELNFLGLPLRPREKKCMYYMRTGGCKYSTNCRYHHPGPTAVGQQVSLSGYQNGGSPQQLVFPAEMPVPSWPLQGTQNEPITYLSAPQPFVPGYYVLPHPSQQWNCYQVPVNLSYPTGTHMQHPSLASNIEYASGKASGPTPRKVQTSEYPERPGQPECHFFMKTGTCKFKGACKFHHPKSRVPISPGVVLNPVGLPLRPDQTVCTHYSRHGICKYGHSCRYNHPTGSRPAASPLAPITSSHNDSQDGSLQPQSWGVKQKVVATIQSSNQSGDSSDC
ncbi:zinc finger CCCH domain-containing protein 65-like [Iris pallida]|uniref:Zinc finger CCCH domain-containing protein 65-like n=1 Tax=Iris pallida TaxID=29817 RepID=A0AAX6G9Q3_IRIPA|nr:zinc finger CCCH domain-containing protein 65-like [Iris pallida]